MDEELELNSALARATSTGVRVMGVSISGYAVGFIASVLIARALGPAGRGLYAYPVALLGIVMALGHVGLEFAQIYQAGQGRDLRRLWANATAFSVVAGAVCWVGIAGVLAIDPRVAGGLPLSWIAVPMGLVPLLLMSLYWASLLKLDGRLVAATWASWSGVALQAVAVGVLFTLHELTPFRVLLLQWLTNGSAWLLLLLTCHRAGLVNLRVDPALLRRSVAFGVRAYVAQVFFFLVLRVDQVLVRGYAGYRQLGLYALATTVAELLWLLTAPLAAALVPYQVRARTGEDRRLSFAMARLTLWISMTAAVGGWLLAPLAIQIVYGPRFAGTASALRLLLPGVVALAATRPLGAVLVKEGRAAILSALSLGALGLNVALNLVLLPRIGIRGASIASSVCYAALALSYVAISRHRGVAGWRDVVPRTSDLRLLGRGRLGRRAGRRAGPLRVAFVVGSLNRGGTERQILVLGSRLVARGHPVTVICLDNAGDQGAAARAAGIRVVEVGFPGLQRSVLLNPLPEIRRFRGVFREASPDVVHCCLPWAYLLGVPIARSCRVPVVVSSRRSLSAVAGRPRLLAPWERVCDRLAGAVVCNSGAVMEDAIRHSGLPRRKAVVIRNGVLLAAEVAPPSTQPQRIVIVANLRACKGHVVALAAFARVRALLPAVEVRLQLAGSGLEERLLRAQARELGIDGDVEFLGSVADVPALLAGCSFTVLPSLSEGLPNAVLESLAHGRAVIASAVGGVPEILDRGGGLLVPPGDPEALADAMCTLLGDPALATRLGAEGRVLVSDWFGVDRMVEESLRLYEGLLAGRPLREVIAEVSGDRPDPAPPVAIEGSLSGALLRVEMDSIPQVTNSVQRWGDRMRDQREGLEATATPRRDGKVLVGKVPYRLREFARETETMRRLFVAARSAPDRFDREHAGWTLLVRLGARLCPSYVVTDYGKLWFEDETFLADYRRLVPGNDRSADRKYFLRSLLQLVDGRSGDTAECGVYQGASSWFICDHFRGSGKAHHVFDSFEGLSEPAHLDGRYWQPGDLKTVEARARATLADFDVRFYPGWIPERFAEAGNRRFCFVHVDVDLYSPTKASLEFFYPRTVPGGIILCDDHGFATCPGATRAVDEFMADRPEPIVRCPTGQAFIVKSP
ncbi:MAG TPA: glycosyltransferase [Streptosporangiaceae bacterium]|nr:glycosyltransferase [Streptosporangiaceae bacterium]